MPVSDVAPIISYIADGVSTNFAFPFKIFKNTEVVVVVAGAAVDLGTDYGVTVGDPGGSVEFLPLKKPAAGDQVDLIRRTPIERTEIGYTEFGQFDPATVNEDFERIVMILQELKHSVDNQGDRLVIIENSVAAAIANFGTIVITSGAGAAPPVIDASASLGPVVVDLVGLAEVIITREDDSGNELKILDSGGATVQRQAFITLDSQDDYVHMLKIGENWRKIG